MLRDSAIAIISFVLGALAAQVLEAQINTNEAVYGRHLGSGVATALAAAVTGSGSIVLGTNPTMTQTPVAVSSLPTCGSSTNNQIAFVNNALTPALGVAVSTGGALTVGVICKNGTGWLVF